MKESPMESVSAVLAEQIARAEKAEACVRELEQMKELDAARYRKLKQLGWKVSRYCPQFYRDVNVGNLDAALDYELQQRILDP